jgi:hypothetical protein
VGALSISEVAVEGEKSSATAENQLRLLGIARLLGFVPEGEQSLAGLGLEVQATIAGKRLDGGEAAAELVACFAESLFGVDAEVPGVVGDVEEEVAKLAGGLLW